MTPLEHTFFADGGVVTRQQLEADGIGESDIRVLLRRGALRRLRRGWYALSSADPLVVRTVTAGGILTCVDALRRRGVWVPEHPHVLHARPPARGARITASHVCRTFGAVPPVDSAVDDVLTAIRYAARCLDAEGFVVVCDSLLNSRLATVDELATACGDAPDNVRALLDRCDGRAESGTETMVRLRLRAKNVIVTTQHHVPGVGYVDLLVGDRLVIEVDSKAHHTGVERYEADRTRDRLLIELGYLPLRLSYRQVVHDWASCERTIDDLIRRREHQRRRRHRR